MIVSVPEHELYGKHLSAAAVRTLVQPAMETIRLVTEWLDAYQVTEFSFSPAKDWIILSLPVKKVEQLLSTTYFTFQEQSSNDTLVRAPNWSLPWHLHSCIETVQPTNSFMRMTKQNKRTEPAEPHWFLAGKIPTYEEMVKEDLLDRGHIDIPDQEDVPDKPTVAQACNRLAISPLCIRTLYGTLGYAVQAPEGNGIGLVNYNGESNNRSDLHAYLQLYRKDAAIAGVAHTFRTEIINGGRDQQSPLSEEQLKSMVDFEGALDIQAILGSSFPIPVTAYNVGGEPPWQDDTSTASSENEPYLEWIQHVMAQEDIPPVIFTSYADEEQTVPESYARRVCQGFAQLGARGISVIFASGDHGVGQDGRCKDTDTSQGPQFVPMFPASCPYVTSVGATRLVGPEVVAFDARGGFVSGGGFSNYFQRPTYQHQHVTSYLEKLNADLFPHFNRRGRAYPDVSAIGYHYVVVWNGTAHLQDGTSASAPTFASVVALLNDALLADGRPPLGFLNPLLYSSAVEGFTDVTIGANSGCNRTGFPATEGWDAASGLGTPVRNLGSSKFMKVYSLDSKWFPRLKDIALRYRYRKERPWYLGY